ncbi:MAG: hypothetical protein COU90_01870 [Candidatus Ryanbacteria bacterium CG10_big_fil_rev_8_21_14_0_10_43_42]|uniref:Glycosyl transferase family 1 domain-containing protein n=1 Tax=Candidatus Ryanbacteria bacterium CG10_big_fil_rev_8_21_14_0_10_43_42 TaxID=1974864 RepID=A0A2M8KXA7_9BACT|nr:MAG: hypothetical protein COU90_01870 [Candidatus Ryanbacteria bacterium CG10_big_fil_rev_8_21_14_0_10_43_42]
MEKSKKGIIIFSTAYLPFIGGAELAVQEITSRIHEYQFFLITARMDRKIPKAEHVGSVLVYRVGVGIPFFDKALSPILALFKARRIMKKYSIHALWGIMASYASVAPILLKLFHLNKNIPFLLTLQEGDSEDHIAHARFGLISYTWRRALRSADHVQVISTYLGSRAKAYGYQGAMSVIPNGVDGNLFKEKKTKKEKKKIIITTSRLVEKNGVDILIRAFVLVKKEIKDARLYIVGDGACKKDLEKLASNLGVKDHVDFVGEIPFNQVPAYLSRAHVFVRMSRSEGLGTAFLEAMTVGLPVIASRVGGIPDFLTHEKTGLYAKNNDAEDVAKHIIRLLTDEKLYDNLSRNGKALVREKYSWDDIASRMNKIFNRIGAKTSQ